MGRELVVAEKSGLWMRVYANTDIEEQHSDKDEPWVGGDEATPPISGWMEAKGVVEETTPNGDAILMGAAANQEADASDPRGAANAAVDDQVGGPLGHFRVEIVHQAAQRRLLLPALAAQLAAARRANDWSCCGHRISSRATALME